MKEKKPPLVERICRALDVLPESVAHTPLIELHGRSLLKITDGGKILLYTNEKITVAIARSESRIASCRAEFPPPITATVLPS